MASRARDIGLPLMNLVKTKGLPILQQLYLEEKLLRTSSDNWCIINDGTSHPAIVMGVSGKSAELVEEKSVLRDSIPVIRRFTGGGTVIVDDGTIFVTLICNKVAIPGLQPYPRPIMSWTGDLYDEVLREYGDFRLRENDYAFGSRKFGGNAQSITKKRWIHHTSFLWDYDVKNMGYLKHPMKAPDYRLARNHIDFLCRMKDYVPSRSRFIEKTITSIGSFFTVKTAELETNTDSSEAFHSCSTKLLSSQELLGTSTVLREEPRSSEALI